MRVLNLSLSLMTLGASAAPNPIRRVVTLLQEMSKEISAELEKERDMHEKFACYCKKNDGELDKKAKEAAALIKKTKAEVESNTALKKQLGEEISKHKQERGDAEKKLESATAKRKEEKTKFDEATKEQRKTLEELGKAIEALNKGMGRSFLQAESNLKILRSLAESSAFNSLDVSSQQEMLSFLNTSSSKDYASQSGEIVGILKMIKQNIDDELGGVISEEEAAVKSYGLLKKSLEELIKTSTNAIEKKGEQKGQAAVKIVEGKNLIATTEKQMGDDMATLAALKESCSDKADEFSTRQADGAAEVDAIHQAIAVLNNDDSLDLFKKTDTKAFLQISKKVSLLQSRKSPQEQATKYLASLAADASNKSVALMAFSAKQALNSRQAVDFSKIYKMIDDMVALLKQEGADDLTSRDSCNESLNENAAQTKETQNAIKGHEANIEDLSASIDQSSAAIEKNTNEIAYAKEAMAGASKQRQEENAEFLEAVELNKEAVELIAKAKDKLNAYYNPALVRKTNRVETAEEAAARVSGAALVQVKEHVQAPGLPEGQPEMWEGGARKNQGQKGASVLSLMDQLANDINKDTDAMTHAEQTAQRDYEKLSQDLATQQVESSKALNQAKKSKADAESEKQTQESTLSMKEDELADIQQTTADLHAKCDFILSAFDERASARENEIAGLVKAKAVLAGAKFD